MEIGFMRPHLTSPASFTSSSFLGTYSFSQNPKTNPCKPTTFFKSYTDRGLVRRQKILGVWLLPVYTCKWTPNSDSENIASQLLSSLSLFPYLGFLYFMTRSKSTSKLTLFGFCFLLAFVGAAGVYHLNFV